MAPYKRIRPYRAFTVTASGERTLVRTHELALERPLGVDLGIDLAPHPNFRGRVAFATFRGQALLIEPGSSGPAFVFIEGSPVGDRRRKVGAHRHPRGTTGHVYLVDASGAKRLTEARRFIVEVAPGRELSIDLTPSAPWSRHVRIESSTGVLSAHLNAANIVLFGLDP